jgi:hypothetical protein
VLVATRRAVVLWDSIADKKFDLYVAEVAPLSYATVSKDKGVLCIVDDQVRAGALSAVEQHATGDQQASFRFDITAGCALSADAALHASGSMTSFNMVVGNGIAWAIVLDGDVWYACAASPNGVVTVYSLTQSAVSGCTMGRLGALYGTPQRGASRSGLMVPITAAAAVGDGAVVFLDAKGNATFATFATGPLRVPRPAHVLF